MPISRAAGTAAIIAALSCAVLSCRPGTGPPPALTREAINPQTPDRPYSQAVRVGGTYYFAGKVGVTEQTRQLTEGRIEAETRNVMDSFAELFSQLGLEFGDVVQGTVYLADIQEYDAMNRVYGEYFPSDPPARETVAVASLVGGARVEISFVAVEQR